MSNFFYTDHATPAQVAELQRTVLSNPRVQQAIRDYQRVSGNSFSMTRGNTGPLSQLQNVLRQAGLPDNVHLVNGPTGPELHDTGGVNWGNIVALAIGGVAGGAALGAAFAGGSGATAGGTATGVGIGETGATTGLSGPAATALLGGGTAGGVKALDYLPSRQTTPNDSTYTPPNRSGSQFDASNPSGSNWWNKTHAPNLNPNGNPNANASTNGDQTLRALLGLAPLLARGFGGGSSADGGLFGDNAKQSEIAAQISAMLKLQNQRAQDSVPIHQAALRLAGQLAPTSQSSPRLDAAIGQSANGAPETAMDPSVMAAIQRLMGPT